MGFISMETDFIQTPKQRALQEGTCASHLVSVEWLLTVSCDLFVAGTTTVTPASEFDSYTLAVLRGRLVRYLMRSREVTSS